MVFLFFVFCSFVCATIADFCLLYAVERNHLRQESTGLVNEISARREQVSALQAEVKQLQQQAKQKAAGMIAFLSPDIVS